jgi:hypothetical protein
VPQVFDIEQAVLLLEIEPPLHKRECSLARQRSDGQRWHPTSLRRAARHEHERPPQGDQRGGAAAALEALAEDSRGRA